MNKLNSLLILNIIIWTSNLLKTGDNIDIAMTIIGVIALFYNSHKMDTESK